MKVLGILSFEYHNYEIEGLAASRPISAVSFLGRYRICDFMLSNFTNSGIDQIKIFIKEKPRSLIQHIHNCNFNINSKRGNISIYHGEKEVINKLYNTDIAAYNANMQYIVEDSCPYVIIAPAHFIYSLDFQEVLDHHISSNNDLTIVYQNSDDAKNRFLSCDVLHFDKDKRVSEIEFNYGKHKARSISLETYVMSKALFVDLCKKAEMTSSLFWLRDVIKDSLNDLVVRGYHFRGFCACINSLKAYYDASMDLRGVEDSKSLFKKHWPINTMTHDSCPTLYVNEGSAQNSIISNGCIIEGTVINSIIGRNVMVKKGAVIKDSIILPSSLINKNVKIENTIIDRYAIVTHVKELKGTKEKPFYVKRGDRI